MKKFIPSKETEGAWETEKTAQPWWEQQLWGGLQEEGHIVGVLWCMAVGWMGNHMPCVDPLSSHSSHAPLSTVASALPFPHPQKLDRTICHAAPWGGKVRVESYGGNQHIGQVWENRNLNTWLQGWSWVRDTHCEHLEEGKLVTSGPGMAPLS